MAKKGYTRVTFDLSPKKYQQLQQLKKDLDAKTATEVFQRLLRLAGQLSKDFSIISFDPLTKEKKEIILF